MYDVDGMHLKPEKGETVQSMPAPTSVKKLQEVLGMVIYLILFNPAPSILTDPIHEVLKKDTKSI